MLVDAPHRRRERRGEERREEGEGLRVVDKLACLYEFVVTAIYTETDAQQPLNPTEKDRKREGRRAGRTERRKADRASSVGPGLGPWRRHIHGIHTLADGIL